VTYQVIVEDVADQDIAEAADWYEQQRKGPGKQFIAEVRAVFAQLRVNPQIFSVRYKDIHTATVKVFPYLAHYLVEEQTVVVIAVLHTSRDPKLRDSRD